MRPSDSQNILLESILEKLNGLSGELNYSFLEWTSSTTFQHGLCYDASNLEDADHGIGLFTILYFLVQDFPVYFDTNLLSTARKNFCSWVLENINGRLPV